MRVTVVGSGSLVPHPRRSTPALAVHAEGFQLTLDGGSGTLRRQAELGIDFRDTRALLFTHVHPDHTVDVLHFLFASKYTPGFVRDTPVWIGGPRGFGRYLDHLRDGVSAWTDGGDAGLTVHEFEDRERISLGPIQVEAFLLDHSVVDLGYRLTGPGGGSVAFTGDTADCPALVELGRGVDVLVTECSGDRAHAAPGHLTAPEVGRAAAAAGAKQVVLTHLYPLPDDRIRIREVAEAYSGPVTLAADGTAFEV